VFNSVYYSSISSKSPSILFKKLVNQRVDLLFWGYLKFQEDEPQPFSALVRQKQTISTILNLI